jgi:hypothetical protein
MSDKIELPTSRRALRTLMREHHEYILDNRDALSKIGATEYKDARSKTNALFKQLEYNREQFIDAITLKEIARAADAQTVALDDMSRRYDFGGLCSSICTTYETSHQGIDWSTLGKDVGNLFRGIPVQSFMLGPLSKYFKPRAATQRRHKIDKVIDEIVRPDEFFQAQNKDNGNGNGKGVNAEATNERIDHLLKHLMSDNETTFAKQYIRKRLNVLNTLVDPCDTVQTVENFFDFAFLIKDQRVMQKLTSAGDVEAVYVEPEKLDDNWATNRKQMVLSMNIPDLKLLGDLLLLQKSQENRNLPSTEKFNDDSSCILHRSDPLYSLSSAREQADMLVERANRNQKSSGKNVKRKKRSDTDYVSPNKISKK